MIGLTSNHLWCCIARRATGSFECLAILVCVAQPKVHQFDLAVMVEKQIFWLHVSVHNSKLVQVLNSRDDLLVKFAGFSL